MSDYMDGVQARRNMDTNNGYSNRLLGNNKPAHGRFYRHYLQLYPPMESMVEPNMGIYSIIRSTLGTNGWTYLYNPSYN